MPGRDALPEDDRARGSGERDREQKECACSENTAPQMLEARHGRYIGGECRNWGWFRYETGMKGARIPQPREKSGDSGGRT
jgi:hypothetical protein